MRRLARLALGGASLALLLCAPASAAARVPAPPGFVGVVPQGALSVTDFARMRGTVGTLRISIFWPSVEPQAGEFDLAGIDSVISAAAQAGVRVLPFVYGTPSWLKSDPAVPPLGPAARSAWRRFLRVLVSRYGPHGLLWGDGRAPMPVRQWQIWNEPNFLLFWHPRPSPAGYARLLETSAAAIRQVDPGARVVAAGLAPVEGGMLPWVFLRRLYSVPGARRSFDVVAIHPYSATLRGTIFQIRKARREMAAAGDSAKPLLVSELGVTSASQLPTGFDWGLKGQATFLRRAYRVLLDSRRRWRLAGVDWYAWRDTAEPDPNCVFCQHAGLFDWAGQPKPAWRAFARIAAEARAGTVR